MRKLPRGLKKYLRRQKAHLRRTIADAPLLAAALKDLQQQFNRSNDSPQQS